MCMEISWGMKSNLHKIEHKFYYYKVYEFLMENKT